MLISPKKRKKNIIVSNEDYCSRLCGAAPAMQTDTRRHCNERQSTLHKICSLLLEIIGNEDLTDPITLMSDCDNHHQ